jgi:hypothetical protein
MFQVMGSLLLAAAADKWDSAKSLLEKYPTLSLTENDVCLHI